MKVTLRVEKLGAPIMIGEDFDGYEILGVEEKEMEIPDDVYLSLYQDYIDDYTVTMEDIKNGDYDEFGFHSEYKETLIEEAR